MRKLIYITLYCLIVPLSLLAQHDTYALFVENEGQWEEDFQYRLRLSSGSMFFENSGYTMLLVDPESVGHSHDDHDDHSHFAGNVVKKQSIKLNFLNANPFPTISGAAKAPFYHNYLIGNDKSKWKSDVGVYRKVTYKDIYPGIDIQYYGTGQDLKYDFVVKPRADWRLIQMQYEGANKISVKKNKLIISTIFGDLTEEIPSVYQIIEGERIEIEAYYEIKDKTTIYFDLGDYDPNHELIIDPKLVFSSFTGSSADNWGFTATYDNEGNLYGGGIVFNKGSGNYPTTTGAFQTSFNGANGDFDIGISKFNEQGNQLIFSTFLGGNNYDIPQSLIVDDNNNIYILGATSSNNFPIPASGSYQENFNGGPRDSTNLVYRFGTDIFISKLSFDGKSLLASTYLGGSGNDGINFEIYKNYGDDARGEIILSNSSVYIISNSQSTDLNLVNSSSPNNHGLQDALVACLNTDLTIMNWGSFFGGTDNDAGYSIKPDLLGNIFISGATESPGLSFSNGSIQSTNQGGLDGYLAKINALNGSFIEGSFIGTSSADQVFLLDIDEDNFVYTFGQTKGSMTITPNMYSQAGSQQFIKKFDNNLENEIWSTQIGSGQNKSDLVPTAFLVDDCYNIYLSGWNGNSNRVSLSGPLGNTNGLPVTSDAEQSITDGSDFYFMVLDRDAKNLTYATYFGGTANEHVDGGTSRFNPNGSIFQAVCAGCNERGFPTTPGAYSTSNGSTDCNLGVIKFDFEVTVRSKPEIDFGIDTDTICDSLIVRFKNSSVNADVFQWDFGNGLFSDQIEPITHFTNFGTYTIRLIAIDTNCNISDTSYLSIDHLIGDTPSAKFTSDYLGCNSEFKARFINSSKDSHLYEWDFGDGNISYNSNPSHQFPAYGSYIVRLTAFDSICQKFSFYSDTIIFSDTTIAPNPIAKIAECGDGSVDIVLNEDRDRYTYTWDFGDGQKITGKQPLFLYSEPGNYVVKVSIEDTSCHKVYSYDYPITIENIGREMFIPNAFSPNGDGLNDSFKIYGNHCGKDDEIKIFNRWGQLIFHTNRPFEEFWDATLEDEPAPIGIYSYVIRNGNQLKKGSITVFR